MPGIRLCFAQVNFLRYHSCACRIPMAMSHSNPGPTLSCFPKSDANGGGSHLGPTDIIDKDKVPKAWRRFPNLAVEHRGPVEIEGGDIQKDSVLLWPGSKPTSCFRHLPAVNCGPIGIDDKSQKVLSGPVQPIPARFPRFNHHGELLKLEESQRKQVSASTRGGQPKRRKIQTQLNFGRPSKPSQIGVFAADEPAPTWMSPAEKASIVIGRMMVDAWSDDH